MKDEGKKSLEFSKWVRNLIAVNSYASQKKLPYLSAKYLRRIALHMVPLAIAGTSIARYPLSHKASIYTTLSSRVYIG